MTSVSSRLISHLELIGRGDISVSTTHRLMALLRQLLEERNEARQYGPLAMFCDWSLHNRLERSKMGGALLDLLAEAWANSRQVDEQIGNLVKQLSPQMLQIQMIKLLSSARIWPGVIENGENFRKLISYLYADMVGKPIVRKTNEQPKLTTERLARGLRFIAERISFEEVQGNINLVLVARQIEPTIGGEVRLQIPWSA